jgi:hypothetical protein
MVDIVTKECKCGKCEPYFGWPLHERPTCCAQCKAPDMVDIVTKKCKCGRVKPCFGLPADGRPTCCAQCKSLDMVDTASKKCKCGRVKPCFGLPADAQPTCSARCKSPDMGDIANKKCKCGRSRPCFGLPDDERPKDCAQCKSPDMEDIVSPRCALYGIRAHYPDSKEFAALLAGKRLLSRDLEKSRLRPLCLLPAGGGLPSSKRRPSKQSGRAEAKLFSANITADDPNEMVARGKFEQSPALRLSAATRLSCTQRSLGSSVPGAISCRQGKESWKQWKAGKFGDVSLSDGIIEFAKTHKSLGPRRRQLLPLSAPAHLQRRRRAAGPAELWICPAAMLVCL